MELEVVTTKKIHVAPCIKCGSDDISIWDANESAFNYGGGNCRKCLHEVTSDVSCLPSKESLVRIWNAKNDLNAVLTQQEKELASALKSVATIKAKIKETKKKLTK